MLEEDTIFRIPFLQRLQINKNLHPDLSNFKMSGPPSFRQLIGAGPSTASTSDSTLIIIDAQNEYAEGKLQVTNAPSSRKSIAALLEKYRAANGKIVHVVHNTPEGAPVFTPNTNLAKEFEELTPKGNEKIIGKVHPSSFADTTLHEYLGGSGGSKIVLTGYMVCDLRHLRNFGGVKNDSANNVHD